MKHLKCSSAYNKHSAHFSYYYAGPAGQTCIHVISDPQYMSYFWCVLQAPVTVSWINDFSNPLHQPSENVGQYEGALCGVQSNQEPSTESQ